MSATLKIQGLSKKFGKQVVLDNINLGLEPGHIYGILGRNGTGKTTLCNIITDKLFADTGEITLDGEKIAGNPEQLKRICHVKEADVFSTDTKVKSIFKTYSYFFENYDKETEERLVKRFGINTKKAYGKLSRGQKSAVTVTAALASNAEITILDEPTTGLDVANRKIFYEELMEKYSEDMGTYIIITHQVGEIERIIEKLIIIGGNKIAIDTDVDNFKSKSNLLSGKEEDLKKLSFYGESKEFKKFGSTKTIFYYGNISGDDLETIKEKEIEVGKAEFEDAFVTITKEVN